MKKENLEKIDGFMQRLESALSGAKADSQGILNEVRADLESHVKRFQLEDISEDEAVEKAIDEMGNPYELAHSMVREIPPRSRGVAAVIRYVMAGGVIIWTLFLLWGFRAWTYGFNPAVYSIILLFHLPVVMLLWPRIVWRKNWLFGLIPIGLALLGALAMNMLGTQQTTEFEMLLPPAEVGGGAVEQVTPETVNAVEVSVPKLPEGPVITEDGLGLVISILMNGALVGMLFVMFMAMQQRFQRRLAFLLVAGVVGGVETAYQIEEYLFRRDREAIYEYVAGHVEEKRAYPDKEQFKSAALDLTSKDGWYLSGENDFSFFWTRPLSSGFAIAFSSESNVIWIQD